MEQLLIMNEMRGHRRKGLEQLLIMNEMRGHRKEVIGTALNNE